MKVSSSSVSDSHRSAIVADPALRVALERFVRAKVPPSEVDDIVQASLTDALATTEGPETEEEIRRWLYGIVRHKIADHFRRAARERAPDVGEASEELAEQTPHSARDLLRWAEQELPEGEQAKSTLEWMLREGQGEKLEHIAEQEALAAPRVRQRVSRLRRYFRERWAQQLAAVAAIVLVVLAGLLIWASRTDPQPRIVRDVPSAIPPLEQRVGELRQRAFEDCQQERWQECLDGLDEAQRLDPVGDARPDVQRARKQATDALVPAPEPESSSRPVPSGLTLPPVLKTAPKLPSKAAPHFSDKVGSGK